MAGTQEQRQEVAVYDAPHGLVIVSPCAFWRYPGKADQPRAPYMQEVAALVFHGRTRNVCCPHWDPGDGACHVDKGAIRRCIHQIPDPQPAQPSAQPQADRQPS